MTTLKTIKDDIIDLKNDVKKFVKDRVVHTIDKVKDDKKAVVKKANKIGDCVKENLKE